MFRATISPSLRISPSLSEDLPGIFQTPTDEVPAEKNVTEQKKKNKQRNHELLSKLIPSIRIWRDKYCSGCTDPER